MSVGLMRVFQNKPFRKWAANEGLDNSDLWAAVEEMENGLVGDSLGANLYKKRIGLNNKGKSGGVRTIIAYTVKDKTFYLHGFAKNEKSNISETERKALKLAAKELFKLTDDQLKCAVKSEALIEIFKPKDTSSNEAGKPGNLEEKDSYGKQNPKKHT